ncbi:kunitz trypsin inhibitor 5-like [Lotus japonicus]|uniref:kunitz trypsin inhibitor 5-like n=1 Tax=Lotus japonicus TaxID=34305 RepID=UPI00258C7D69|nr:kunitz trypsin inhibitor 5-like [Lotus japonicus]
MKTSTLLAFVLLFAFISQQPLLGAAEASPEQVVDITGKKLRAGTNYYILPASPLYRCGRYGRCRSGEGLSLASTDKSCPLDVVLVSGPYGYHGIPLTFRPVDSKKGVIRVSTDLNIMFQTDHTSCAEYSPVWKIDASKGKWFVSSGGSVGNPGWKTIYNWFKIEKSNEAYKLVYCPNVVQSSKHLCKNIGLIVDDNGNRRLALSDVPFKVKFQKA